MPFPVSPNLRGAAASLAAFGFYATHDAVVKFLGASYTPFQIIFYSTLFAFPLVTVLMMRDRTDGNLIPRHPWWVAARSGAAVINVICGFYAFSVLPLAQAYAIFFAMPILITLLAIPMLGERVGLHRGLAVVAGLAGVLIVLRPGGAPFGLGQLAALTAASTGAFVSVVLRKIGPDERSAVILLYPMMANFLVMAAIMPFVYQPLPVQHLGLLGLMAILGFTGGMFIIVAYRAAPAVIVAPMQYSQIIWAVFYAWLLFDEKLDLRTAVGIAVIVASGLYIVLREGTPRVSENTPVLQSRSRADLGFLPRLGDVFRRR
ncbi:MAG: DMT family transporter [Rhodobacteraceae bacterium]|nr:DMT family transporter [Paracoccaceae bacterium]